jgi:hypothetical protein
VKDWEAVLKEDKDRASSGDVEALGQMAIENVLALRRENAPRIGDPLAIYDSTR